MDYILMIMPVDALTDGRHGKDVQSRVKEPTPTPTYVGPCTETVWCGDMAAPKAPQINSIFPELSHHLMAINGHFMWKGL